MMRDTAPRGSSPARPWVSVGPTHHQLIDDTRSVKTRINIDTSYTFNTLLGADNTLKSDEKIFISRYAVVSCGVCGNPLLAC